MFELDLLNNQIIKTKKKRRGLSVVYGLPVSSLLEKIVYAVQSQVECRVPSKYSWYKTYQLHTTIVRGKSSLHSPANVKRILLEDIIQKINESPPIILKFMNAKVFPDGYIRMPCDLMNALTSLTNKDIQNANRLAAVGWSKPKESWMSVGHLKDVNSNVSVLGNVWKDTIKSLSRTRFAEPFVIEAKSVKIIHFSNTAFVPPQQQYFMEIPLNSVPILHPAIEALRLAS